MKINCLGVIKWWLFIKLNTEKIMRTFFLMLFTLLSLIDEANQKTVNEIYLTTWANGIEIDSTQFLILENIACQNPLNGGSAVYGARTMIGLDYQCANGANRSALISEEENLLEFDVNAIRLFPNPNNGLMTIEYENFSNENAQMFIYDLNGKEIKNISLPNELDKIDLNFSDISEGMYYYSLYLNGNFLQSDKLIIIR